MRNEIIVDLGKIAKGLNTACEPWFCPLGLKPGKEFAKCPYHEGRFCKLRLAKNERKGT